MADNNVFITGAESGALEDAFGRLPGWATQNTLEVVEGHLRKSTNIQKSILDLLKTMAARAPSGGGGGGLSGDALREFGDELARAARNLARNNAEEEARAERAERLRLQEAAATNSVTGRLGGLTKVLGNVAGVGTKVLKANTQYITTFDSLYKSGINVVNGLDDTVTSMQSLQNTVILTGLRLEQLQAISQKYSQGVNAVGFAKFASTAAAAATKLEGFGFGTEEALDITAAFIDQQTNFANIRNMSERQLSEGAVRFARSLTSTSQALGISRDKLLEQTRALSETTDASVIEARFGAEAAQNVMLATAGLNPQAQMQFLGLVADSGVGLGVLNDTVQKLIVTGNSYSSEIMQMGQDLTTLSPGDFRAKWKGLVNSTEFGSEMIRQQFLKTGGKLAEAGDNLTLMAALKNMANKTNEATESQTNRNNQTAASTNALTSSLDRLSSQLQAAFAPTIAMIDTFTGAVGLLNTGIEATVDYIGDYNMALIGSAAIMASFLGAIVGATGALGLLGGGGGGAGGIGGIGGILKLLTRLVAIVGAAMLVGAGVDTVMAKYFGEGKEVVDEKKDDANWERMGSLEKLQSGAARSLESIGRFFQLDAVTNDVTAGRIKRESAYLDEKLGVIPEDPAAIKDSGKSKVSTTDPVYFDKKDSTVGTVNSPVTKEEIKELAKETPTESTAVLGIARIDKPNSDSDINNILNYQSAIFNQMLQTLNNLVSVNKEILKYSRIN